MQLACEGTTNSTGSMNEEEEQESSGSTEKEIILGGRTLDEPDY